MTWNGDPLPKSNYEIELEGRRVMGIDFFCAMTFPVQENTCSFVVGGWAGSIVGLSNIDDEDASENDTTKYMSFKKNQWYKLRVRVTDKAITCWIDDKQVVQQPLKDKRISIRPEVELNKPLGFCSFETESELRNLRIRRLSKAEQDK